ncbi:hypothetical protein [Komagataeibacter swingsii]|uniref:Uncharacterized protein n=1 Tax=Komagataeibacter swingsii TaxID=215220 RepID=A0A2V4R184_9PROT|nr:hypothetical protein [Komagataeibacter swingsii]PYD68513.1 hypothetical protein CFR76_14685 [Komagataeibacter swingsii]GBQ56067.1 hypothetical protein AA16373_0629 [Komagataeibacter swingsii DSM 16373]
MENAMARDGRIMLEFLTRPAICHPRADTLLVVDHAHAPVPGDGWAGVVTVGQAAPSPFSHGTGCACCAGRGGGLAAVLGDVFRRRATGALKWFDRVAVLPPEGQETAWRAALSGDIVVKARFAMQPPHPHSA